jgi:putative ABC transport system permease protein
MRNLAVRKTTSIAAGLGLAMVVFIVAAVAMLNNGIKKALGRSSDPNVAIVIRKGSDVELSSSIEEPNVGLVLATPGVARSDDGRPIGVGEVLVVILLDKVGTDGFSNVQVRGMPDNGMQFRKDARIIEGRAAKAGTDEVVVGKAIRGRFKGVDLGQSFELRKNRSVSVVGVFEDGGTSYESEVWGDRNVIGSAFGREGFVSSARVRLDSPSKFDAFKSSIESNQQLNLEALRDSEYYEKQSGDLSKFIGWLGGVIAFFFALGAIIGAMITMYAAVANRQREIGTLRALGFSKVSIIVSFMIESILLAFAGGVLGAVASLALSVVKISMLNFTSWSEIVIAFEPDAVSIGMALTIAVVMGICGGMFPAIRAARMNPIQAMRA